MHENFSESRWERIRHAGTMSAVVGPLVALLLVGFLARLQNFFCPANFLPLYAGSFLLLAPGFFLIGLAGAETALRLGLRGMTWWVSFFLLAAGGGVLGALYFESLAFALGRAFPDYAPLLTLPGLSSALASAAALAATWSILFRRREPQALGLR